VFSFRCENLVENRIQAYSLQILILLALEKPKITSEVVNREVVNRSVLKEPDEVCESEAEVENPVGQSEDFKESRSCFVLFLLN
jgi:hypothetical protein